MQKYEAMGSPAFLASAYIGLGNESDMSKYAGCFDETIAYRYPNRGGYIATVQAAKLAFQMMVDMPNQTGDDCFNWYEGWREGWFRPALDSNCEIFQVSDMNAEVGFYVDMKYPGMAVNDATYPRLHNRVTKSNPCILHLSGGYTDPETGKDVVMVPWARNLGIL
jgi:hypothetical protein